MISVKDGLAAGAIGLAAFAAPGQAQASPLLGIDFPSSDVGTLDSTPFASNTPCGGGGEPACTYFNSVLGYEFTVSSNTEVVGLGVWNGNGTISSDETIEVGLWDTGGADNGELITSVTFTPSTPGVTEVGDWWFIPITAVDVVAGSDYTVGAYVSGATPDDLYMSAGNVPLSDVTQNVVFINNAYNATSGASGFLYPSIDTSASGNFGWFGGNVEVSNNDDPDPDPAPEPASLTLFAAGLAGLGLISRRRRKA